MKRILPLGAIVIAVLLGGLSPSGAEYYKYRDAQGNIRYTDNLADVPENQRPATETFKGVSDSASPDQATSATPDDNSPEETIAGEKDGSENADEEAPVVDEAAIDALNARKEQLDREQADLMESKRKLQEEKTGLQSLAGRDVKARQAYEEKAKALNRKIDDYQKRLKQFQKDADAAKAALNAEK